MELRFVVFSATYNTVYINEILKQTRSKPLLPSIADRSIWEATPKKTVLIAEAEAAAETPLPLLTAGMYLDSQRTGQYDRYMQPREHRRTLLVSLLLGECVENKGRFLDYILDLTWAICEETTWCLPSYLPDLQDIAQPQLDLGAAITALSVAELDSILGDRLHPTLRQRIRYEVDRRLFTPYMTHIDWWMFSTPTYAVNNWAAVCSGNIAGAALYLLEDQMRLAHILAQAIHSLDNFLKSFGEEGVSTEGIGYWGYGFGNYVIFADLIDRYTNGVIDLFDAPQIRAIATFPLHTMLSPGHFVSFSDCDHRVRIPESLLCFLSRRLELPDLARLASCQLEDAADDRDEPTWRVRDVLWPMGGVETKSTRPLELNTRDWYPGIQWLISRMAPNDPAALVAAIKGGHNDELHNQNDLGSLIIHRDGENLITDLGRGRYVKGYFDEHRYEFFVNRSRGHSVPLPNDTEQMVGASFAAHVVTYKPAETDQLILELGNAYPGEADIQRLTRSLQISRITSEIILEDEVSFREEAGMLESVLITLADVAVEKTHLILQGEHTSLRVTFNLDQVRVRVEELSGIELQHETVTVCRIAFRWHEPAHRGVIRLVMT